MKQDNKRGVRELCWCGLGCSVPLPVHNWPLAFRAVGVVFRDATPVISVVCYQRPPKLCRAWRVPGVAFGGVCLTGRGSLGRGAIP